MSVFDIYIFPSNTITMTLKIHGGVIYSPTCLNVEASLKNRAKNAGINMSRALAEALETKLATFEHEGGQPAKTTSAHDSSPNKRI
jgi:post-segregation antitoxin (ccd killing protein)